MISQHNIFILIFLTNALRYHFSLLNYRQQNLDKKKKRHQKVTLEFKARKGLN